MLEYDNGWNWGQAFIGVKLLFESRSSSSSRPFLLAASIVRSYSILSESNVNFILRKHNKKEIKIGFAILISLNGGRFMVDDNKYLINRFQGNKNRAVIKANNLA